MARMYSRKRGKSGSTRPLAKKQPSWVRYKPKEVELLIVKLVKEGYRASRIGIILRDTYGIPDVEIITKKRITQILKEKALLQEMPDDLAALMKKLADVKKHFTNNIHDMSSLRGIQLTESKIKRLVKYYKRVEKLPDRWSYDSKKVELLNE